MYICIHVKYPLFLLDFNETWTLPTDLKKNNQMPHFIKIRPVGAELFHVDRRTDRHDEAISHLSLFCKRA